MNEKELNTMMSVVSDPIKNVYKIESRKDLEELLGQKVYLELFVKTIKNWRDKEKYLQEFGFSDFLK